MPAIDVPDAPIGLSDEALRFWERFAPALVASGRLTTLDEPAFELMCIAYATAKTAAKELAEEGISVDAGGRDRGVIKKHPAFQTWRDAMTAYLSLAGQFGMTPHARGKVPIGEPDEAGSELLD